MTAMTVTTAKRRRVWRVAGWGLLAGLLAMPAVAMRFTAEVNWTALDFLTAAVLFGLLGLGVEFGARRAGGVLARLGMGVAVLTAFLLVWVNLAVGIIGSERNDANLLFAGVLAAATGGALLARFRPAGMARAMLATAAAQTLVGAAALALQLGTDGPGWPRDVIGATVIFDGLWLLAAALFRRAAAR